jgi:mono/diheme cytochrome c family protein
MGGRSLAIGGAVFALLGCGSSQHAAGVSGQTYAAGRAIFVQAGCGGCHTLKAAGTHGVLGPDFDRSERLTAAQIRGQLDLGAGGMPSFRGRLTPKQEETVAAFLSAAMRRRH